MKAYNGVIYPFLSEEDWVHDRGMSIVSPNPKRIWKAKVKRMQPEHESNINKL